MCYDLLESKCPIRQGDIFYPLPYIEEISLKGMQNLRRVDQTTMKSNALDWDNLQGEDTVVVAVPLGKTWGIVASQNCDASRIPYISLFRIEPFTNIDPKAADDSNIKWWVKLITKTSRLNASWFYLPKDERLGISNRMAINFHSVFQIPRLDLEANIKLRKGRLGKDAYEHYREAIAQYFRRYPYNDWYPMNKEEASHCVNERRCSNTELYPWQK